MPRLKRGAELKLERLTPAAVEGGWSITRLAQEAGVGWGAASRSLKRFAVAMREADASKPEAITDRLRLEARKAHERALARLEGLGVALDAAIGQLRRIGGKRAPGARETALLVKACLDHWRLVESLCGLDVAKAVAIRQTAKLKAADNAASWDGVAALNGMVHPLDVQVLPAEPIGGRG